MTTPSIRLIFFIYLLASSAIANAGLQEGLNAYHNGNYRVALKELPQFADKGDAASQFILGAMNNFGQGVPKDYTKAMMWYLKAADQGYMAAQLNIGVMYSLGIGVPHSTRLAEEWYRKATAQEKDNRKVAQTQTTPDTQAKAEVDEQVMVAKEIRRKVGFQEHERIDEEVRAAEQGNAIAQFNLGMKLADGQGSIQDYTSAMSWLLKAANQGNASAEYRLGVMYANGEGVQKDYSEAVMWYRKAAEHGDVVAQFNLGVKLTNGQGVAQNYKEAMSWYSKAAEQGQANAQNNLGVMYFSGQGVPRNLIQAYKWVSLAGMLGDSAAPNNMKVAETSMTSGQIEEAQSLVRAWLTKHK